MPGGGAFCSNRWVLPRLVCASLSVFVGVLANDILPAKAGEVVRCFLLSYETEVPLSLAITSDVILRIMDGWWIVIVYLIITFQISTHVDVTRGMWFLWYRRGSHRSGAAVRIIPASACA